MARPCSVLVSGANRLAPKRLAAELGVSEVRRGTGDEVRAATGFAIGGVPPFGHRRHLAAVLDPALLGHDVVWAAAGLPDAVFPIAPAALQRATGARTLPVTEPLDEEA